MSWLVGAAVAVAVLAGAGPGGRRPRRVALPPDGGRPHGRLAAAAARLARPRASASGPHAPEPDLALVVTEVAARLRGGAEPRTAWQEALGRPVGPDGVRAEDLGRSPEARSQAAAVVAAGRLADELGAPLAPLLDGVAEQLRAQAEAEGERRAALAGPRATARVLTGLPVLGVLLATAVGADPLAVLLGGGVGSAALAAGLVLVLVGNAWTHALARAAAAAGRAA